MNMKFVNLIFIGFFLLPSIKIAAYPRWPIDPNVADWNRVNGTFGEIHPTNNDHFHSAIDIDHTTPNCPARAAENGRVLRRNGVNADYIELEHEYPVGSGNYYRRTRYFHLQSNNANMTYVVNGQAVAIGDPLAAIDNSASGNGNHLHFEMWQYNEGEGRWHRVDPLNNTIEDWCLRYHQEGRPDQYDPQINDIFVAAAPGTTAQGQTANGVASGFDDTVTVGGLSRRVVNQVMYCRVHLIDTTGRNCNYSQGQVFHYPDDRLVVFGNIGFIANARDVGTDAPPDATVPLGCGLTLKQLQYTIIPPENPMKYSNPKSYVTFSS